MSCAYRECDPSKRGGCPCAEVRAHGGPMDTNQIAEVLGKSRFYVANLITSAFAKIRRLQPWQAKAWQEIANGWPEGQPGYADTEKHAPEDGWIDSQAISAQLTRKAKEYGWDIGERSAVFCVPRKRTKEKE